MDHLKPPKVLLELYVLKLLLELSTLDIELLPTLDDMSVANDRDKTLK